VVIPAKELFQTVKNPVLASVFIKVKEGEYLSPQQIAGIVSLVASSVEDLKKKNVTVVDYYGRVLNSKEYAKDYEMLKFAQASTKTRKTDKTLPEESIDQMKPAAAGAPASFFDIYAKKDQEKQQRQTRFLMEIGRAHV
jgi:flagellar M-ring protein FliF